MAALRRRPVEQRHRETAAASIDKSLADALAGENIPTVGLDALHYFWTHRSEDEMGRHLAAIVRHYLAAWHMDRVLLIGYSSSADVLPFISCNTRLLEYCVAKDSPERSRSMQRGRFVGEIPTNLQQDTGVL